MNDMAWVSHDLGEKGAQESQWQASNEVDQALSRIVLTNRGEPTEIR